MFLLVLESDFAKKKRSDRPSNTALPKRDAPISLGSLQDALCSTMCKVLYAIQYSYSHFILKRVWLRFTVWPIHSFLSVVLDISSEPSLCNGTEWRWLHGVVGAVGHSDALMHCVVGGELDALCGWNTQMYPVLLMHWCALWLMMNSIDDYIAICTAHTLIAWCVFCFSKHYNASNTCFSK